MTDNDTVERFLEPLHPDTYLRSSEVPKHFPLTASHLAVLRHRSQGPRYSKHGRFITYRVRDIIEWLDAGLVEVAS
ncbi:hypothetical protein [Mycobacteroides abscessus]|uniref:hypothetical protein n=1 Tax=Mycobacteroides abscessus TaxID=36809 RepID=UPI0009286E98|nr:hypothetical protein [Mycobacteroides abscessus]SIF34705.1 Uncharacterised protein [Mycobacteroides abscessus subsp. abscessus]